MRAKRTLAYEKEKEHWERFDRVALNIMDMTISPTIRGALEKEPKSAKCIMQSIEGYFKGSANANSSTLLSQPVMAKYNGQGSVREHIMGMINKFLLHFSCYEFLTTIVWRADYKKGDSMAQGG